MKTRLKKFYPRLFTLHVPRLILSNVNSVGFPGGGGMKAAFWIVVVPFLLLVWGILLADTVTLRNGGKLHGKVIKESEEEIVLRITDIGTMTLRKRDVVSVQKDQTDATAPPPSQVTEEEKPAPAEEKPAEKASGKEEPANKEQPTTKQADEKEAEPDPELKAQIDELIQQLALRRTGYRSNAKAKLAEIGKPAVSALIKILKEGTDWQREGAAELLGTIGDKRATEPLINALPDTNEFVRKNAIDSLSTLTNQTLDFVYDAPEADRQEAVKKWQEWLAKKKEEEAKKKEEEEKKKREEKPQSPAPK
jgi:hypothetical protein